MSAPDSIELIQITRPVATTTEVVVAVAAAGICGSDVEILHGTRPAPYVRYPIVPGHEWAGTLVEVGEGVVGLQPGDRVVAEGFRACGRCARCKEGQTNLCMAAYAETGFTHSGAFAEFVSVPAPLVHKLPGDADLEAAALLEPAACVAQGLLEVDLNPGMRIAVVGTGTIGLVATALSRLTSPSELVVFSTRPDRLDLTRRMGATQVVPVAHDEVDEMDEAFDLVLDATNRPTGARAALRLARRGGTVVLEGISGSRVPSLLSDTFALKHLRVQGVFGASGAAWCWVVQLFSTGLLDLTQLITHRFTLEEHRAAFAAVEDRRAGALKVQMHP